VPYWLVGGNVAPLLFIFLADCAIFGCFADFSAQQFFFVSVAFS